MSNVPFRCRKHVPELRNSFWNVPYSWWNFCCPWPACFPRVHGRVQALAEDQIFHHSQNPHLVYRITSVAVLTEFLHFSAILELEPVALRLYSIKGVKAKRYLCMDGRGRLIGMVSWILLRLTADTTNLERLHVSENSLTLATLDCWVVAPGCLESGISPGWTNPADFLGFLSHWEIQINISGVHARFRETQALLGGIFNKLLTESFSRHKSRSGVSVVQACWYKLDSLETWDTASAALKE